MSKNNYFDCLKIDVDFGSDSERDTLQTLRDYFKDDDLEKTKDKYCPYDFYSETKRIELKTRRNSTYYYPTTMITLKKVQNAETFDGDYYFVFKFTDGLYYIKYDKRLFDTFERHEGGRKDRFKKEMNIYVFIPIENLTEI